MVRCSVKAVSGWEEWYCLVALRGGSVNLYLSKLMRCVSLKVSLITLLTISACGRPAFGESRIKGTSRPCTIGLLLTFATCKIGAARFLGTLPPSACIFGNNALRHSTTQLW
jgi:hypothetical protein